MKWSDIGRAIKSTAPVLAGALGGPGAALAGSVLAHKLGVKNTPESVKSALDNPSGVTGSNVSEAESIVALAKLADRQHARAASRYSFFQPRIIFALGLLVFGWRTAEHVFGMSATEGLAMSQVELVLVSTTVGYVFALLQQAAGFLYGEATSTRE